MREEHSEQPLTTGVAAAPTAPPPKKKKRKIRPKTVLIALGILLVVFVASVQLTSTSKFCSACHYMKPFYQSWQASAHGKIECKVCHYPPGIRNTLKAKMEGLVMVGRYWTKLYLKSKPWAEIQDESCLQKGCHDKRLLEGPVQFKTVAFDHKAHFADLKRGKQLRCTSCHSQIVQGQHITVTEGSCFICHFKKTENFPTVSACANCHKKDYLVSDKSRYNHQVVYDKAFACDKCHSQVVIGDGIVPRENCYKCHFEKERLDQYDNTNLIHTNHIAKNKIECTQCHLAIQHKIVKDVETIADCKTCHTGAHQAQRILYTGVGGKGVDHPMPNVMLEKGLSCKGCHMFHEETGGRLVKSEISISGDQACESCHGTGFRNILKSWEASTAAKLAAINAIYQQALQEVRKAAPDKQKTAAATLDEASFNIDVVDRGKSVHNISYAQELLHASLDKIEQALAVAGSAYKPDRTSFKEQKTPNACLNCHQGIDETTAPAFGMSFPHKKHVAAQDLACEKCHSNAKRHGEIIAPKSYCTSCHHKDPQKECTACHTLQQTIYRGGMIGETKIAKDVMAEAETDCKTCHVDKQKAIIRPTSAPCVECHDKTFDKTFADWREGFRKKREEVRIALRAVKRAALAEPQKAELAAVEALLRALDQDGSFGIHNHAFAEQTLTGVLAKITSWGKT
jgi:nitrate/TMAO reductase-like tetraheme cytochrome c subunit